MNKKYKQNGKAVKWIDTRFARPYKWKLFSASLRAECIRAAAHCQIIAISSAMATTPEEKARKSFKIAEITVNANAAINEAFKGLRS